MEDASSCPVCNSNFPLSQLERHVNGHFEDDEIARDMELAYQIAMASPVQLLQQRTEALEKSLQRNVGWQKLIKRGVHTLKQSQYQFCYIDYGIASEAEIEQLKTINSVYIEI